MSTPFDDDSEQEDKGALVSGGPDEPEVSLAPPDEQEDDDKPPSRQDKKSARYQEAIDRAERAAEEARQAREELAAVRARIDQMPPPPSAPDPRQQVVDNLYEQRQMLQRDYFTRASSKERPLTQAEVADYEKRARKLEDEYIDARAKMHMPAPVDPRVQQMQARYPDIVSDAKHLAYANGVWYQKIAMGKRDNPDLWDEVVEETRKAFRLGKYRSQQHTPAEKAAYTGSPRGGNAGPKKQDTITMTKENKAMADSAFPHIKDDRKRWEHWAQAVGKVRRASE